jgi:hypothetical protein
MKIGVDLDNTIVNYESAFLAAVESLSIELPPTVISKVQIRAFLRSLQGGEVTWQKVQALAYGRFLPTHAKIFPGVKRFLWRCRELGHTVVVVSHKTKIAQQDDEMVPLRIVASDFLVAQKIILPQNSLIEEIIYHDTQKSKISYIKEQNFDWFIDDLIEIISALDHHVGLNKIFFAADLEQTSKAVGLVQSAQILGDWQQIDSAINGAWTDYELSKIAHQLVDKWPQEVVKLVAGGNGGVYQLEFAGEVKLKLKIYPVDSTHDRLLSESVALNGLVESDNRQVAKMLMQDFDLGVGLFDWIEGQPVSIIYQSDLESSVSLLSSLHRLKNEPFFTKAPLASAACFSGVDIEAQIARRIAQFQQARQKNLELEIFFAEIFLPTLNEVIPWARDHWPKDDDYRKPIEKTRRTLSPSDFGFHNAVRRSDGSLVFIDFEYFGWDDPVKLLCDFIFHPGMCLSEEQQSLWLTTALKIYGIELRQRVIASLPLYGMIWCLIVLNDFRPEIWSRRTLANNSKCSTKKEVLERQMQKANVIIQRVRHSSLEMPREKYFYDA